MSKYRFVVLMVLTSSLVILISCATPAINTQHQAFAPGGKPMPVVIAWGGFQPEYPRARQNSKHYGTFSIKNQLRNDQFEAALKESNMFQGVLSVTTLRAEDVLKQAKKMNADYVVTVTLNRFEYNWISENKRTVGVVFGCIFTPPFTALWLLIESHRIGSIIHTQCLSNEQTQFSQISKSRKCGLA